VSEAELMESLFSIFDRYWAVVQWWASVSFGLLLVAHFAADRLRGLWVTGIIFLYVSYSAWVYLLLQYNVEVAKAMMGDLQELVTAGTASSGTGVAVSSPLVLIGTDIGTLALSCTFLGCIAYLLYSYYARKSARQALRRTAPDA
jgi:hypothetical protein